MEIEYGPVTVMGDNTAHPPGTGVRRSRQLSAISSQLKRRGRTKVLPCCILGNVKVKPDKRDRGVSLVASLHFSYGVISKTTPHPIPPQSDRLPPTFAVPKIFPALSKTTVPSG